MTNQMLVFGGNHNGINCIQKTDAEKPCDKIWFTAKQIEEWSGMSTMTLNRRLHELEEFDRITSLSDLIKTNIPDSLGVLHETTIYNLNVLNQLAMVEMKNKVLNETAKKFSDILSEVETTGTYGVTQKVLPNDYLTALKALVAAEEEKQKLALEAKFEKEQKELALNQRDEAIRTKTHFVEGRDAKLSGQVGGLVKENNRLKDNLYGNRNYRTIRAVANANHLSDRDISWRRLKAYCITNNLQIKKVQDEKFGTISSYPVEAFKAVYPELTIN